MTETRRWLESRRRELMRRTAGAGVLLTLGLVFLMLAVGVVLGRLGAYQRVPAAVLLGWMAVGGAVVWGLWWWRSRRLRLGVMRLAAHVERSGGQRRGSVAGIASWTERQGSAALASLADGRTARWLAAGGGDALGDVRRRTGQSVMSGAALFTLGAFAFLGSGPVTGAGAAFWRPVAVLARAGQPVVLTVDRTAVRRGEHITVSVAAPGRPAAELWVRAPGDPWTSERIALDTAGRATVVLGPLESDRFLRAVSGRKGSGTVHVRVSLPALLADLRLLARYPAYVDRADEPLAPGAAPLPLPVGTRIVTSGRATVALAGAAWRRPGEAVRLPVEEQSFRGVLPVSVSARWTLEVIPLAGGLMDEEPSVLVVEAVADSAPFVAVPVPGIDTAAALSLRQPLLIDARDDHGLMRMELVTWRVSRHGEREEPRTEPVPLPAEGAERAVIPWVLELEGKGYLPGDTAFYKVRAFDNAPAGQMGESRTFALWLPAMAELRKAARAAARAVATEADSLVRDQTELARQIEDLAAERERGEQRDAATPGAREDQLPFASVERARELLAREDEVLERARQLQQDVRELADAAWAAGLTDPEFQRQLAEIEDLLERSLSEELQARLEALRDALQRLDPVATREALQELARSAEELREELARGRELFERAAIEGDLTSLSRDARELAAEQREWNREAGLGTDSAQAAAERELARRADSLAAELERLDAVLDTLAPGRELGQPIEGAGNAAQQMRQAAEAAERGESDRAQRSGESASAALEPLASQIEEQRDELREEWRREVMAQLDRALVETAELARQQQDIARRLGRGESDGDVRGTQAATREGVDHVMERLQQAAGRNALVPPRLGAALGLAKLRMAEALDLVQRANPDTREAEQRAGEALDALNYLIYALLQTQGDVGGSQSGSGLQEAIERLAELAEQQGALSAEASGLLSMSPAAADQLSRELRALAERQRALAQELERLNAGGEVSGADQLAAEAEELADRMESGRLDRELLERQERLFRRLLDAGRSLESDEEDERRERVSEAAGAGNVLLPEPGMVRATEPRYPYPTWEELRALSPEERRLILDYFRRLNGVRR